MDVTTIIALLQNPETRHLAYALGIFWLISVALHSMPTPETGSGLAYRWLYSSIQFIFANFGKLKEAGKPFENAKTVEAVMDLQKKPGELVQAVEAIVAKQPLVTEQAANIKLVTPKGELNVPKTG